MNKQKLLEKLSEGRQNIQFTDAVACAEAFGFHLARISGSHHIFIHTNVSEPINLQNVNGKANPYQVKQLLRLIEKYDLLPEESP
ncbi:MAG: type II toxin-antitoxin system HicA family toxin [Candidatus Latescibacterota bacterium]